MTLLYVLTTVVCSGLILFALVADATEGREFDQTAWLSGVIASASIVLWGLVLVAFEIWR